jgi:spermidine synthase
VRESLIVVGFGIDTEDLRWKPNMLEDPVASLLASYAGQAVDMGKWTEEAQINTDRNLRLQYLAGISLNVHMETEILDGILKYYKYPSDMFTGSQQYIQEMKLALEAGNRKQ